MALKMLHVLLNMCCFEMPLGIAWAESSLVNLLECQLDSLSGRRLNVCRLKPGSGILKLKLIISVYSLWQRL